jgi:hydrogenase maturation factor
LQLIKTLCKMLGIDPESSDAVGRVLLAAQQNGCGPKDDKTVRDLLKEAFAPTNAGD